MKNEIQTVQKPKSGFKPAAPGCAIYRSAETPTRGQLIGYKCRVLGFFSLLCVNVLLLVAVSQKWIPPELQDACSIAQLVTLGGCWALALHYLFTARRQARYAREIRRQFRTKRGG